MRTKRKKAAADPLTAIFAANVAHHRRRCHLTLANLAAGTGPVGEALTPSYVLLLEQGRRSPSLETVRRLAAALGVNVCTILSERGD
jgi:transcriptional regulator with XRE-family HTH domain